MKAFKIILTVLITIIIVVVGFAAEILALVDSTVINPWYYRTPLNKLGFYNELRNIVVNDLDKNVDENITVSEDFKDKIYVIVENALPKKTFSNQLGEFFSGTVRFILYGNGDGHIPINDWLESIKEEVKASGIAEEIVTSEIEKNNILEEDKEYYIGEYERVLILSISNPLTMFTGLVGDSKTFSEAISPFIAPTEKVKQKWDNNFYIIRYWIKWAIASFFICIGVVIILTGLLFLIWRKKPSVVFKICSISLLVNSIIFICGGIISLVSISIAKSFNLIPLFLIDYLNIIKAFVKPLGIIIIIFGIILLLLSIMFSIIKRRIISKELNKEEINVNLASGDENSVNTEV